MEKLIFQTDQTGIILLSITGIAFLLQIFYYLVFYAKPLRYQRKKKKIEKDGPNPKPPVSVIIYSQNESENLKRFLPAVLTQDYPSYEVIVVTDGPNDESADVLLRFEKQYNHLYHTYIPDDSKCLSRKKLALTVGIKAARHDILLFTEPSCEPCGNRWLAAMCRNFSDRTTLVLGFSPFVKGNSLKEKFAAYHNLINGLQYLSFALFNRPYRGVGRNMAYKKSHFFEQKGYSKFMHLSAGEDDLFINQIATPENTAVEISPESLVQTSADGFEIWKEIRRHQSLTQRYYKPGPGAFWKLESVTKIIFYLALIGLIIHGSPEPLLPAIAFGYFLIRFLVQLWVINKTGKLLGVQNFYFSLLLFDGFNYEL